MKAKETITAREYDSVRSVAMRWPAAARVSLIHDLLRSLTDDMEWNGDREASPRQMAAGSTGHTDGTQDRPETLTGVRGLLVKPGVEPPTDEDVSRWLDERRMEKYG